MIEGYVHYIDSTSCPTSGHVSECDCCDCEPVRVQIEFIGRGNPIKAPAETPRNRQLLNAAEINFRQGLQRRFPTPRNVPIRSQFCDPIAPCIH